MSIKLLVIDDDPILSRLLNETLTIEGFQVFTASSGSAGIETARLLDPDVIILDLMMPEMSGWEVCRMIRSFSTTPILILSAVIDSEGVMRALEEGANDYLVKPAPPGVLTARLKRLARQARIDRNNPS